MGAVGPAKQGCASGGSACAREGPRAPRPRTGRRGEQQQRPQFPLCPGRVVSLLQLGCFVSAFGVAILKMLDWVFKRGLSLQLLPSESGQAF